jgi:hypothetical protein
LPIYLEIPLPPDGVLIFSSFMVRDGHQVRFSRNEANTPVTILVSGDVTIAGRNGYLVVSGASGANGQPAVNGEGGLGGPGGFRGGSGAYELVNVANRGGDGLGPGGGSGGTPSPLAAGEAGTFVGVTQLVPLVGGSGGGGGASSSSESGCSAGGGGGGGGAILIASNGTITVNGGIQANGGSGGNRYYDTCSSSGGSGSGGAIRLVANTIAGSAVTGLRATGGSPGAIRMEAIKNTMYAATTSPVASRAPAPGPLSNPLAPTVDITSVSGQPVPAPPQGSLGGVDVVVSAPGPTTIEFDTSRVPSGTVVEVTVKPRVGGSASVENVTLDPANCDGASDCTDSVTVDLASGAYTIEARATFQIP